MVCILETKIDFYDEFKCTADKCPMTCCMQWKIAVDDTTFEVWKKTAVDDSNSFVCKKTSDDTPAKSFLGDYVTYVDSDRVIELNDNKRCPFLDINGLCSLVLQHGDSILSDTCDVFPRQTHVYGTKTEKSLVACCPAVIDFIRERGVHLITQKTDEFNINKMNSYEDEDILFRVRELVMKILADEGYRVTEAVLIAYYIILDIYDRYEDMEEDFEDSYSDSFIKKLYKKISEMKVGFNDRFAENNEIWLDMTCNYQNQGLYREYIESVSKDAEGFSNNYDFQRLKNSYEKFESSMNRYENLLRNYLLLEAFSNLYVPECDITSMVIMFQWIAMEYVMIRHALFLNYIKMSEKSDKYDRQNKCKYGENSTLNYELIRDIIVVVSRMTGYDESDIYEYMENSFQSVVWEWGYMALIIGIGGSI